jgi:hypothetical protein
MLFLLFILILTGGGDFVVDRRLPQLPPLPAHPRRAYATLHTDSNACYDMALLVFLASWNHATQTSSQISSTSSQPQQQQQPQPQPQPSYPMLVLYSTPTLPPKVAAYIEQQHNSIQAIQVPERISYVVQNPRWRKCATKFAVWNVDDLDQVAYYDSDHIFRRNNGGAKVGGAGAGDAMFEQAGADPGGGNAWLYAAPDRKYRSQFNAGKMLVRPSHHMYEKLVYLYNRRFWIMDSTDMIKSGDQRFLNAVFRNHWQRLDTTSTLTTTMTTTTATAATSKDSSSAGSAVVHMQVQHAKVWKLATFPSKNNATRSMARQWIDVLGLRDELKECMQLRIAYGNQQTEKGLVEYW